MKKILLYFNLTLILSNTVVFSVLSFIPQNNQSLEISTNKNSEDEISKKISNNFETNPNYIFLHNEDNVSNQLSTSNLNQNDLNSSNDNLNENKNQSKQFNNSNFSFENLNDIPKKDSFSLTNQYLVENDRNDEDSLLKSYYKLPKEIEKQDITISKKIFTRQYEKNIRKKASKESIEKFNKLYDTSNNQDQLFVTWKDLLANSEMKLDWEEKINNQFFLDFNAQMEFKNELLRFYNIMAKVYNLDGNNIFRWVSELLISDDKNCSFCIFNGEIGKITINLLPDFFQEDLRNKYYNCGFIVSKNIIHTVVHEYGHILDKLIFVNKEQRLKLNKEDVRLEVDRWKSTFFLMDFLNKKARIENEKEKELFPLIVVRSNYGRFWAFEKQGLQKKTIYYDWFICWSFCSVIVNSRKSSRMKLRITEWIFYGRSTKIF